MRAILIFLTILILIVLSFFCLNHRNDIQQDIINNVTKALINQKMDWATISVDGRDVTLKGIANTKELRYQVEKITSNINGVRTVNNKITLANIVAPSPYNFNVQYNGRTLRLSGYVDNIKMRSLIIKEARNKFGAVNIIDNLKVAKGSPDGWTTVISKNIFDKLSEFNNAVFSLSNKDLLVQGILHKGKIVDKVKLNFKQSMNKGYNFIPEFVAFSESNDNVTPVVKKHKVTKPVNTKTVKKQENLCQIAFNTTLAKDSIYFAAASTVIDDKSREILEQLIRIAKSCPSTKIEIIGYADSQGSDGNNSDISEKRAKAVVIFLINHGVNLSQLIAKGYGKTKSIASNNSPKGRAKNRRVEFIIKE